MIYDKVMREELMNIAENRNKAIDVGDDDFEIKKPIRKKLFARHTKKVQVIDSEEGKSL